MTGHRCQALTSKKRQCSSLKTKKTVYFGNPELYGYGHGKEPTWVVVYLCDTHGGFE